VIIYETVTGKDYPTSTELDENSTHTVEMNGRHVGFFPRIVKIDRRVPTTVVWINETSSSVKLQHDILSKRDSDAKTDGDVKKDSDPRSIKDVGILARNSFTYTFRPGEHPPGLLYYTVGPNNQPGGTLGSPPSN
jgi:hypothetical protein